MKGARQEYDEWHSRKQVDARHDDYLFAEWVLDAVGAKHGQTLLDVACGKGAFCGHAFRAGLKVFGVDFSKRAIRLATSAVSGASFLSGDGQALPYASNDFDIVTCLGSLEHFANPSKGIGEIRRVLRDDGIAFVFLPNLFFIGHVYFGLRHGLPPDEGGQCFSESFNTRVGWQKLIEENGLGVSRVHKYNRISAASNRVPQRLRILYNKLVGPLLPMNASYAFGYVCRKNS